MTFKTDIETSGFSLIDTQISQSELRDTVLAYRRFIEEFSLVDKLNTHRLINQNQNLQVGFIGKKSEFGYDDTGNFHFNKTLETQNFFPNNKTYQNLIERLSKLYKQTQTIAIDLISNLEKDNLIDLEQLLNSDGTPTLILKILDYNTQSKTKLSEIVKQHSNQSVLSFVHYETDSDSELQHSNKIKVFPGMQWNKASECRVPQLYNDGIPNFKKSLIVVDLGLKIRYL